MAVKPIVVFSSSSIEIPTNVVAAPSPSALEIDISWDVGTPATIGYLVDRANVISLSPLTLGAFSFLATNADNTYPDVSVMPGDSYAYRVRSYDVFGDQSGYSAIAVGTAGSLPTPPTNLSLAVISASEIDLTWIAADPTVTFSVVQRSLDDATWATVATVADPTENYNDTGLAASTTYFYRVYDTNPFGNSTPTASSNATTNSAAVPNPVSGLSATAVSSSEIDLVWTNNGGATSNKVQRSPDGTTWATISTLSGSSVSYQDKSLPSATTFFYQIIANNSSGDAPPSNVASAATQSAPIITVPSAHPRLGPNTPARQTIMQNWWATHSYTLPPPPWNTVLQQYSFVIGYLNTPSGATKDGYTTIITNRLFGEDPLQLGGYCWPMGWAYMGTVKGSDFVPVGVNAAGLAGSGGASDNFRSSSFIPLLFDAVYTQLTSAQITKYLNGWTTTWNVPWGSNGSGNIDPSGSALPIVNATGGGATGGSLTPGTYRLSYAWSNATGETPPIPAIIAPSVTVIVAAGNIPRVTVPALKTHATGWSLYLSTVGGPATSQRLYARGLTGTTFDIVDDNPLTEFYTVKAPSYTTVLLEQLAGDWGSPFPKDAVYANGPMPGNNYFHGKLQGGLMQMLAIWYEDSATAANLYNILLGPQPGSFWEVFKDFAANGSGRGGAPTEGTGYGRYEAQYVSYAFLSLMTMGRDLFQECPFWDQMLLYLIHALSPQQVLASTSGQTWYQIPSYSDEQFDLGFAAIRSVGDTAYWGGLMGMMSIEHGTDVTGQYARQMMTLLGVTTNGVPGVVQAMDPHIACIDPNTSKRDWSNDGLPLVLDTDGMNHIICRSGWGLNASVWLFQMGKVDNGAYHHHRDFGSFQVMRGNRWLSHEQSGYGSKTADYRFPSTVQASPAPTATVFSGIGLPTTVSTATQSGGVPNYPTSGFKLKFTSGALLGQVKVISNITGQQFTTAAFTQAPAAGDTFEFYNDVGRTGDGGIGHNCILIGGHGEAQTPALGYGSPPDPTILWKHHYPNAQAPIYSSFAFTLSSVYHAPGVSLDRDNPYADQCYVEYYWFPVLECALRLDHINTKTCAGNVYYPAWDVNHITTTLIIHSELPMVVDGANKALEVIDTHAMRVITLLPSSVFYNQHRTDDFTTPGSPSTWYRTRMNITDNAVTGAVHYQMNVIQARDASDADVTASLVDNGSTWTVTIAHPTKGTATLTLNKALVPVEGTASVSGGALSFADTSYPFADGPQSFFADTPTSIVVGSTGGHLYRYDEATGVWSALTMSSSPGITLKFVVPTPTPGKWCFGTTTGSSGNVYQYDTATGTVTLSNATTANQGYNTAVYIPGVYTLIFRGFQGDVYKTTDGLSFSLLSTPTPEAIFSSVLAVDGSIWMGGEDATQVPLRSTDNGVTWSPMNDGTLSGNMLGIDQAPTSGDILCTKHDGSSQHFMFRITSGGVVSGSFTGLPTFTSIGQVMALRADRVVCAVASNPPYLSSDDGHNWAVLGSGIPGTVTAGHFGKTSGFVYYASGAVVYKSAY